MKHAFENALMVKTRDRRKRKLLLGKSLHLAKSSKFTVKKCVFRLQQFRKQTLQLYTYLSLFPSCTHTRSQFTSSGTRSSSHYMYLSVRKIIGKSGVPRSYNPFSLAPAPRLQERGHRPQLRGGGPLRGGIPSPSAAAVSNAAPAAPTSSSSSSSPRLLLRPMRRRPRGSRAQGRQDHQRKPGKHGRNAGGGRITDCLQRRMAARNAGQAYLRSAQQKSFGISVMLPTLVSFFCADLARSVRPRPGPARPVSIARPPETLLALSSNRRPTTSTASWLASSRPPRASAPPSAGLPSSPPPSPSPPPTASTTASETRGRCRSHSTATTGAAPRQGEIERAGK